jgi:hypothetical protein
MTESDHERKMGWGGRDGSSEATVFRVSRYPHCEGPFSWFSNSGFKTGLPTSKFGKTGVFETGPCDFWRAPVLKPELLNGPSSFQ